MVRQYIGARYVTKIYENSLDPESAEWESSVNYEPLTMVTYNFGSYLSKKEVPASVGNPADNPTYWVQTGFYNGQISSLQQQINDMKDEDLQGSLQNQINMDEFIKFDMYEPDKTGASDVSSKLVEAIGDAVAAKKGLYISEGSYLIDAVVSIANSVTILGAGRGKTVLKHGSGNKIFSVSGTDVDIIGITFVGNTSDTTHQTEILLYKAKRVSILDCEIKDFYNLGIQIAGCGGSVVVKDCYIHDNEVQAGIVAHESEGSKNTGPVFIVDNLFENIGLDSISIANVTNGIIKGNYFYNSGTHTSAAGIYMSNCSHMEISNNYVNTTTGNGIDLYADSQSRYIDVINNSVINTTGVGICCHRLNFFEISKNSIYQTGTDGSSVNGGAAISIIAPSYNGLIKQNLMTINTQGGIYIEDGSIAPVYVIENEFESITNHFIGGSGAKYRTFDYTDVTI